jgi:hypothetical protein
MEKTRISRRQFLTLAGTAGGAALLVSCAPTATTVDQPAETGGEAEEAARPDADRTGVHCQLNWYSPTEWTSRSAEQPVVVNATRILAQHFEETNPDIEIMWDEDLGGFEGMTAKVAAAEAPDLVWSGHNFAVQNGWALPIGEYLDQPNPYAPEYEAWRDIFYPSYMLSLKQPDNLEYCAPIDAIWPNIEVGLAYNKDMLTSLGLEPPATWTQEKEVARALKESGDGFAPWPLAKDAGDLWPLALQLLPSLMQPICQEMDLNGDKFVGIEEALPAFKSGLIGPKTPIYRRAWAEMYELGTYWLDGFATTDIDLLWRQGKIGLMNAGSWDFSKIANDPNVTFERGFVPVPIPDSSDIPATATEPGAVDAPRTTAGDGTVPGDLINAIQGAETVILASSVGSRNNLAETINWWQFITTPESNSFMVNENQRRISSAVDASLGPIWQEIAMFQLPLYDYAIAWWGMGLYWDNDNFMKWRPIFVAWLTGQIDEETFYQRQHEEFAAGAARYEEIVKEQAES